MRFTSVEESVDAFKNEVNKLRSEDWKKYFQDLSSRRYTNVHWMWRRMFWKFINELIFYINNENSNTGYYYVKSECKTISEIFTAQFPYQSIEYETQAEKVAKLWVATRFLALGTFRENTHQKNINIATRFLHKLVL